MPQPLSHPRIVSVRPLAAVAGGRVTIRGSGVGGDGETWPEVRIGDVVAQVVFADRGTVACLVPPHLSGASTPVRIATAPGETAFLNIGAPVANGVHQVDSPVFGGDGTLYLTYSGTRGDQSPVSVFRVSRDGFREPFVTGITNPTSMAIDSAGRLHVSSRFDGKVFAVDADGRTRQVVTDLGVACGLAFGSDGALYVGDRTGTVFQVTSAGQVSSFATFPPSVAAFHLAMAPTGDLYVTAPTLSSCDPVYRIDRGGAVTTLTRRFGRPQGLAFGSDGALYVVEALAGASGLYRVRMDGDTEHVVAAPSLVGVAFDPTGGAVVVSDDTAYRFDDLS
jgi:outer membrane protein assembly factor BamB